MTDESIDLVRSFRVGKRTCTLILASPTRHGVLMMEAEWQPDLPRRLTKRELRQYRDGRDAVMAELAREMGGTVMVAEI